MADSVYRVTEVIGVSSESWEAAAKAAVETAAKTVRDLRVAEVVRQDVTIQDGGVVNFRVRLALSFKYQSGDWTGARGRVCVSDDDRLTLVDTGQPSPSALAELEAGLAALGRRVEDLGRIVLT